MVTDLPSINKLFVDTISRRDKEAHLLEFSEDAFRDQVVRPLFTRQRMRFIRDTCGPTEEGKDCIFEGNGILDQRIIIAVQTKRGHLNLTRKMNESVIVAITQIRTALETTIALTRPKAQVKPNHVILCVSGKLNEAARKHIATEVNDPRVTFLDANDLILQIDEHYPEFWYGIDANRFPYLQKLKEELLRSSDTISIAELGVDSKGYAPITDESYVPLYLSRITTRPRRERGEVVQEPDLEQIKTSGLLRQEARAILIVGEGGAGKTTALRRIAYELAQAGLESKKNTALPVFLRANEIVHGSGELIQLAAEYTLRFSATRSPTAAFSTDDAARGNLVILVDALDELGSDDDRRNVLERISRFQANFPKCLVVVTSRDYAFTQRLSELNTYRRYRLTPLDIRQASRIVERFNRGGRLPKEAATEMLRRLQDVHGLALNPMLVTVFVATSDFSKKDIPPNITEIFKKFTELMLGRWDEKKGLAQQYQAPVKDFLLCSLAFQMHRDRRRSMPLEECREIIEQELIKRVGQADTRALFDEVVHRSGLLRVEEGAVEFTHHLLQEFFAGRGVPSLDYVKACLADDWWRLPIVFYFGEHAADKEKLKELADSLEDRSPLEVYEGAVTVGLALQACYLAEREHRTHLLGWVVRALAASTDDVIKRGLARDPNSPLTAFLFYYLFGRDAVACDFIANVCEQTQKE